MDILGSGCLLQSINGFLHLANSLLLVISYKTVWVHHIDVILKMVVEKRRLDIHLLNLVIEMSRNG